jgi:hypothetical protein
MVIAVFMAAAVTTLVAGCDSTGRERAGLDGYWKGQMTEELFTGLESMPAQRENKTPRRILLQLEESGGIVRGQFAESSDAITFRSLEDEGSRQVQTFAVTGTLDGTRVRLSFAAANGRTFDIDGIVDKGSIKGTYVSRTSTEHSEASGSGQFELERF